MIKTIETIALVLFLGAIVYTTTQWGMPGAVVVLGIGMVLYTLSQNYLEAWKRREALKNAAVQIDNSYIYSEEGEDCTVRSRAQTEALLLGKSGNKEFLKGNIKVHALYYRPSLTREELVEINKEDKQIRSFLVFSEDYDRFLDMVQEHQDAVEADHHIKIAKEDGHWYLDNALKQD
ncbi:hypothetical protein [Phaeodactylibacter sp.]|uniref:hypothetical protein n=1 Tax=Phaeodactylibacter sp. TaxID=1940289 RepID=UPI0025FD5345|nr:hypothetical protein [Phaeodactylibacter sp.]MCI4650830.1 hypothetical protein [Phaeodactylibacter sp.]MCI5089787.1 hypothetical protein [Phaeodactylibacter sp.]